MEIIVRPATVEDAAALVEVYSQSKAQRETLQLPNPPLAKWVERLSSTPAGVYRYVAEIDGKVVGNIGFHHSQNPRTAHTASFGIGVHDQFHGLGVGSALIRTVTELADKWLNIRRIQIEVNADNEAAIGLYKKHGFTIEGEAVDRSFRDGEFINTYYMARIRKPKN